MSLVAVEAQLLVMLKAKMIGNEGFVESSTVIKGSPKR